MRLLKNRILIKPFPADEKSEGGIFVPLSARDISNKVLIVDVGEGTKEKPMRLKKGQTGFRVKGWKGALEAELEINGEVHFIVEESDILATV